jgi:hypothetical protein
VKGSRGLPWWTGCRAGQAAQGLRHTC